MNVNLSVSSVLNEVKTVGLSSFSPDMQMEFVDEMVKVIAQDCKADYGVFAKIRLINFYQTLHSLQIDVIEQGLRKLFTQTDLTTIAIRTFGLQDYLSLRHDRKINPAIEKILEELNADIDQCKMLLGYPTLPASQKWRNTHAEGNHPLVQGFLESTKYKYLYMYEADKPVRSTHAWKYLSEDIEEYSGFLFSRLFQQRVQERLLDQGLTEEFTQFCRKATLINGGAQ